MMQMILQRRMDKGSMKKTPNPMHLKKQKATDYLSQKDLVKKKFVQMPTERPMVPLSSLL
jgi:hypothetical protein